MTLHVAIAATIERLIEIDFPIAKSGNSAAPMAAQPFRRAKSCAAPVKRRLMMTAHASQLASFSRQWPGGSCRSKRFGPSPLSEYGDAAVAEVDDEIGVLAHVAGSLGLGSQRAADFDDEVFPFGIAHLLPIALEEGGFLQFAGGDLVAAFVEQFLKCEFLFR